MYAMVQNADKLTLVSCIVPLAFGIYWRRANNAGALASVVFGLAAWTIAELVAPEATVPPQFVGLAFSLLGMFLGSLVPSPVSTAPHHR